MSNLNIWLIKIGEQLPLKDDVRKMRTAILAQKLIENGNNVVWWTSAFNHFTKRWTFNKDSEIDVKPGFRIIALKGIGYRKTISFSRFIDHRVISFKFRKMAPHKPKPDIIVTATPSYDLAYEALRFAKKNEIPIIVDIRDKWPDIFLNILPRKARWLGKMALYSEFSMTKSLMREADNLVSMMDSLLEWGLNYAEREKKNDRVFYIGATRTKFENSNDNSDGISKKMKAIIKQNQDKFIVTFVGMFNKHNNPNMLIDAARILYAQNKDIVFILAGSGDLFDKILIKSSALPNVSHLGFLSHPGIMYLLKFSKLGILPTNSKHLALPNKMFVYLSMGLPIISSFDGDSRYIIERYKIGYYIPPGSAYQLSEAILKLYSNKELYNQMSRNATLVFEDKFVIDNIYDHYAEHIEMLALHSKEQLLLNHTNPIPINTSQVTV